MSIVTGLQLVHYNLHNFAIVTASQFVQIVAKPSSRSTGHLKSTHLKLKLLKLSYMS